MTKYYLTETGENFKGNVIAEIANGHATYSGDTVEELQARYPNAELLPEDEIYKMIDAFNQSLVSYPEEITEEQYYYALECLPPCRFDGNIFHVGERIRGNLVSWYGKWAGTYYTFTDYAHRPLDEIKVKFKCAYLTN